MPNPAIHAGLFPLFRRGQGSSGARRACWATLGLLCLSCTLRLEDPEAELRERLGKGEGIDSLRLIGRFLADSTYALDDEEAESLGGLAELEFHPDGSYTTADETGILFPGRVGGTYSASGDTLRLRGERNGLFIGDLSFLDHYLALYEPARLRFAFYHRLPVPSDSQWAAMLSDSRWLLSALRDGTTGIRRLPQRDTFEYWVFSGDTLRRELNRGGVRQIRAVPFTRDGAGLETDTSYLLQLLDADTLRVWRRANVGQGTDSNFSLLARRTQRHPLDLAFNPFLGSFTATRALRGIKPFAFHFGEAVDFDFAASRVVNMTVDAQTATWPAYTSWRMDSGQLVLEGAAQPHRYRLETPAGTPVVDGILPDSGADSLVLRSPTVSPADQPSEWWLRRIDPVAVRENPFLRHPDAPYLRLVEDLSQGGSPDSAYPVYAYGSGTLKVGAGYRWEAFSLRGKDSLWFALHLPGTQETYPSSTAGFRFLYQDKNDSLGIFTCVSEAATPFTFRRTNGAADHPWIGTLQGRCRITAAERPPVDSLRSLSAHWQWDYQSRKSPAGPLP